MKDSCFLITRPRNGGGNVLSSQAIIVRRTAAIGDALAATVVADKLADLGFLTQYQTHANIHCVVRHCPNISSVEAPAGFCHVDLDGAYENNPARRRLHFSDMFIGTADNSLRQYGISLGAARNCRASLQLNTETKQVARARFQDHPRPWIFLCPRSDSYVVRQVPDGFWAALAPMLPGTKFWVGRYPGPAGIVDLQIRHMDNMVAWLSAADLLVSVDTGPAHIGIALGIQTVMLGQSSSPDLHFSDQRDFETLWPEGNLPCLNCQQNICPKSQYSPPCQNFSPEAVAHKVICKLNGVYENAVSAAIAIYRPEKGMLNHCLECLLPQVQEIVVCVDQGGIVPEGAMTHGLIRYVSHNQFNIGYGRKMNFATRHTCGRYILQINDDVFLKPDAVAKMKECMTQGVGIVSCLLRYPNGTIQHAGKIRAPGQMGWGHLNHRQHIPDIKSPTEQENTCGACWMVDRRAHFEAGGYDERYFIYAEDDSYCLQVRSKGYKIIFTPFAEGTHLEHQSTSKTGPIIQYLNESNRIFGQTWGKYLEHNKNRVPGDFSYLKA